jgi:HK97 family phage major capsid protein
MALKAKELRNKAKQNQARMQSILETSAEKMTADQEKEFDTLDKDAEEWLRQADKIEKMEKREITESESEEIQSGLKTKKLDDLKPEEKAKAEDLALRSFLKTGQVPHELRSLMPSAQAEKDDSDFISKSLKEMGIETRATQTTTTTGGGYLIPRLFQAELEKAIKAYGGMWESSRILKTSSGGVLDWPTVNDTMNKAYLLAESTSAATSAQAVVFGTQAFEAYKYTSGLIQVPTELLEDAEFNVAAEMVELLAERIWRGTNEAFTIADGSSKPHGIIATGNAVYGASTGNDTVLAYDDLVNLEHSVDPGYRNRPGTAWMFHDTVLKELKKIKDTANQPIWRPDLMQLGEPAKLFGYRYYINQDMPIFWPGNATDNDNDKAAIFGDLKKYIIRQVRNMRIVRLNERYGELDQVAFVVFLRVDGDLLNAGTDPVKYLRVSGS